MRRAKLGDVYYIKVPNGYKLFQWAYKHPRKGSYIRVFPNLYQELPNSISEIANSKHSYIIGFPGDKAYRIGIAGLMGNYPVPEEYPFPKYGFEYGFCGVQFRVRDAETLYWVTEYVDSVDELPPEFRSVDMLDCSVTPDWIMYLFDSGFDLSQMDTFYPHDSILEYTELYEKVLNEAIKQE